MNESSNLDIKDSTKETSLSESNPDSIDSDEYSLKSSLSSNNSSKESSEIEESQDEIACLENMKKGSLSSNALGASSGTFAELQALIDNAQAGSTINLGGKTYVSGGSAIEIGKSITINGGSSSNMATLDARELSHILNVNANKVRLLNCRFINSPETAVLVFGNDTAIENCAFDDNDLHLRCMGGTYRNVLVSGCSFTNGHSNYSSTCTISTHNATVRNCIFQNNIVQGDVQGHGAALQIGYSVNTINEGYVINCSFINNTVICTAEDTHAGALCFRPGIKVYNSTFIDNYCNGIGGATTLHSDGELFNCTFINNTAGKYGGAISTGLETDDISVNITGCTFIGNKAPMGGAIQIKGNNVKVTNSIFKDNKASETDGGAVFIMGNDALVINSTFNGNYAKSVGAGLLINGSDATILNSSFNRNIASYGAGIYVVGPNANLFGSNFTNHDVRNGSVYIEGKMTYVYDCIFANNTGENGAGLYIRGSNATLILSDFRNNNATKDGGAVFVLGSYAKLIASQFLYNNALPNSSDLRSGLGGAVYIKGNDNVIDSSDFRFNTARNGSAIYTDGRNMNLSNVNFDRNQAWSYALDSVVKPASSYFNRSDIMANLTLVGGNNIANAIYNTASVSDIYFHNVSYISSKGKKTTSSNEVHPVDGAANSRNGTLLYQDSREDNQLVNVIVYRGAASSNALSAVSGNVVLNRTYTTGIYGNVSLNMSAEASKALAPGSYILYAQHYEDDYYKAIDEDNGFEILPLVDVAVDIVSSKDTVEYNKTNKFTIKVINNGPNNATDVKVSAPLPKGLILVSSNPSVGAYNASSGIWTIGNLNAGANQSLAINTRANATGIVSYPVSVSSLEKDTNESNNRDNQSIRIPECDLLIDINASSHSVNSGEYINWTVYVKNSGPDDASKVTVTLSNLLSNDLAIVKSNDSRFNLSSQKMELSKLASGQSVSFAISTKANASNRKVSINGSVSTDTFEYNLNNNCDSDYVNILPLCDVGITVKSSNRTANRNDVVKWTIGVKNYGPDKAADVNVLLSDLAGLGLSLVNKSDSSYSGNEWHIGDLDINKSRELVIYTKVNAENRSIVLKGTANTTTYETNRANNVANDTLSVNPLCDVLIEVTASANDANMNDIVNWTISLKNNGPNPARDVSVKLTDLGSLGLAVLNRSMDINNLPRTENSTFRFDQNTYTWSIGDLGVGVKAGLEFMTRVNCSNSNLLVEGVVNTSTYELNKANNVDDDLLSVAELCDLAIKVNVSSKSANAEDIVNWTIDIRNNGPDTASDVFLSVSDLESLGLRYINASDEGFDGESYTWDIGSLQNGKGVSLVLTTEVDTSNETVVLEGMVDTSTYELNKANNLDEDDLYANPLCDLVIDVSVSESPVNSQDIVNWTITVRNEGPDDAANLTVNLTDLESLKLEILDVYIDSKPLNASDEIFDQYQWTIGDLPSDGNTSLVIATKVNTSDDVLEVDASVKGDTYELNLDNNHDSDSLEVEPLCDLAIEIKVSDSPANADDIVNWTIIVRNDGPDDAENVVVNLSDLEALNLEILDVYPGSEDLNGSFNPETYEWTIGDLDNNETASIVISTKVNTSNETVVVDAEVGSDTYELNKDNNYDNDGLEVNPLCDLAIEIKVSDSPVNSQDIVNWTIDVRNDGPDDARNVTVNLTDLAALNLNILDVYPDSEHSKDSFNPETYEWTIGDLDNNESARLIISTRVNDSNRTFDVDAEVSSDTYELNLDNNRDNDILDVNPLCDLIVSVVVSESPANAEDVVNWTIVVTNDGPDDAKNVVVNLSDLESLNLEILDVYPDSDHSKDSFNPETYEWNIGDLDNNESASLIISTKVNTSNETVVVDAEVGSDTYELNKDNNYDNDSLEVNPLCDLAIEIKVSDSPVNAQDIVNWTVTVRNDGPDNAENVVAYLTDLESLNLEILDYTDSLFDKDSYQWHIGNLKSGDSTELIVSTRANDSNKTLVVDSAVDSDTYELNIVNNYDNETLEINPLCDLVVDVELSDSPINKDDIVNITVTVRNDGPDTASNVSLEVNDLEDLGLIVLNVSDDRFDNESNRLSIGDLAPGESFDLIITGQANTSNVSMPVEAIVDGDTFELNKDNNHDDKQLDINPLCDLVIEVTVSNRSVNKGDIVEWTIIVYNNGPDDASNVKVSLADLKALGLNLLNVSYGKVNMNILYDGSRLYVKNGSADGSRLYVKNGSEDSSNNGISSSDSSGNANSNASSSDLADSSNQGDDSDLYKSSNMDSLLGTSSKASGVGSSLSSADSEYEGSKEGNSELDSSANDASAMDDSLNSLKSGSYLSDGDSSENANELSTGSESSNAVSAESADAIGSAESNENDSASADSSSGDQSIPNTFNNETNEWYIGDLANGSNIELKMYTEVERSNENITLPGEVDTSTYEIVKSNNHDEDQVEALPICDLEITITPDKDSVSTGETVNWIVTLSNNGPDDASNVSAYIDLPDAFEFKAYDLDKGILENISDGSGLKLRWDVGDLASNETIMLVLSTKSLKDGVFLANVSVNSSTLDSDESNNQDYALVEVIPDELTVNKTKVPDKAVKFDRNKAKNVQAKNAIPLKKTGNPLAILVLTIFALFSLNYRKLKL